MHAYISREMSATDLSFQIQSNPNPPDDFLPFLLQSLQPQNPKLLQTHTMHAHRNFSVKYTYIHTYS